MVASTGMSRLDGISARGLIDLIEEEKENKEINNKSTIRGQDSMCVSS
jgi:hypothetical protein